MKHGTSKPKPQQWAKSGAKEATNIATTSRVEPFLPEPDAGWLNNFSLKLRENKRFAPALAGVKRGLELEIHPENRHILLNSVGNVLLGMHRYEEAEKVLLESAELEPRSFAPWHNLGLVYIGMGRFEDAIRVLDKGLEMQPAHPEMTWDRCLAHLASGDLKNGFAAYESRLSLKRVVYNKLEHIPFWDGKTPIPGKKLWIRAEQGVGDSFQFARYFPWIKEKSQAFTIYDCFPSQIGLLKGHPGLDRVFDRLTYVPADVDIQMFHLSAPVLAGTTEDSIPEDPGYIKERSKIRSVSFPLPSVRPEILKVGLVWAGNKDFEKDHDRSMLLESILPLTTVGGACFYSFQIGDRADDLRRVGAEHLISNLSPLLDDWAATASILRKMDLLISVDTGIVHLAGCLGVPTWVLLSAVPDWRWTRDGESSRWYPSVRLFRQEEMYDWDKVIERVRVALKEKTA